MKARFELAPGLGLERENTSFRPVGTARSAKASNNMHEPSILVAEAQLNPLL